MRPPWRLNSRSSLVLALVVLFTSLPTALAQRPSRGRGGPTAPPPRPSGSVSKAEPAKGNEPDAKSEAPSGKPAEEAPPPQPFEMENRFKDPRAVAALQNNFTPLYPTARTLGGPDAERRMNAMAAGQSTFDKTQIPGYVQAQLAQLTDKQNIEAMLNPASDPRRSHAIEEAGLRLLNPLLAADKNANAAFRTEFTRALVAQEKAVLANHLYARLMYVLALSRSGDPGAVPVLTRILEDKTQPIAVQVLAATGLTNSARALRSNPYEAMKAGRSAANFLERERDSFWPAQIRALEALGTLRQAASDLQAPKADLEATALSYVADPRIDDAARAWAAWALGMMKPNAKPDNLNYHLMAYHIARAAADIGSRLAAINVDTSKPEEIPPYTEKVKRLTDLLVQLYVGFGGDPNERDTGLLQFNLGKHQQAVNALASKVKALVTAAVDLSMTAGVQIADKRAALSRALGELQSTIDQTRPTDLVLFPGATQSFPIPESAASAPARSAPAVR